MALHAAARNLPANSDSVIVIGAGTIGLMVIAAIRAFGSKCRIISLTCYPFQAEDSRKLGADEVISSREKKSLCEQVIKITGGRLFEPLMGKPGIFDGLLTHKYVIDDYRSALNLVRNRGKNGVIKAVFYFR